MKQALIGLAAALALAGCGGATKTAVHRLPAPSAADVAELSSILVTTPYRCSFANIGSSAPTDLQTTVTELEGMMRRVDPNAAITPSIGPSPTTLRQVVGNVIRTLDGNGQPTCDPGLGAQLSRATGVPSS